MTEVNNHPLLKSIDRVRKTRAAERVERVMEGEVLEPVKTTSTIRARLNVVPDEATLKGKIQQALAALSCGVRWARGSILNLLV